MSALTICRGPDGTAWNGAHEDLISRNGLRDFDRLMQRGDGEIIKHAISQRKTVRLRLPDGCSIYLKRHYRAGFLASLKKLLKFSPEPTAFDEFANIAAFHKSGIPTVTPVCAGRRGAGPLQTESFLVTLALGDCIKLDDYLNGPLSFAAKLALIDQTAGLIKKMHGAGFNHRDLYLCHILRDSTGSLFVADLHRVQRRVRVPERWLVKDIAALNYSAPRTVSRTCRLRFLKAYLGSDRLTRGDRRFILKVLKKTRRMLEHNNSSPCIA
jgi:hypothetical protein